MIQMHGFGERRNCGSGAEKGEALKHLSGIESINNKYHF
jgi:hypothetical protein